MLLIKLYAVPQRMMAHPMTYLWCWASRTVAAFAANDAAQSRGCPTDPTGTILGSALRSRRRQTAVIKSIRPTPVLAAGRREMAEVKIVAAVAMRTLSKKKNANP